MRRIINIPSPLLFKTMVRSKRHTRTLYSKNEERAVMLDTISSSCMYDAGDIYNF